MPMAGGAPGKGDRARWRVVRLFTCTDMRHEQRTGTRTSISSISENQRPNFHHRIGYSRSTYRFIDLATVWPSLKYFIDWLVTVPMTLKLMSNL